MAKMFMTTGEGASQTLSELETDKVPVYDSLVDANTDLSNLEVGQIGMTKDTGAELANPVDTVEKGNLHAVTSNAVADSLSYATTEQATGGKWINGKPIYRKVIDCGALPDAAIKRVATEVPNLETLISIKGLAYSTNAIIPLPFTDLASVAQQIRIFYEVSYQCITLNTAGVFSTTYTNSIAIIEYTKTTD